MHTVSIFIVDIMEVRSYQTMALTIKLLHHPIRLIGNRFSGPCYETAAEIRAYRALGADAIGMSTVPETIAANYLGLEVLGIACITNMATGIAERKHSHEEVLAVADRASADLCRLVERVIEKL